MRLVCVRRETGQLGFVDAPGCAADSPRWIHAHVERTEPLRESSRRIIELHRGHAQVGENHVRCRRPLGRQRSSQAGEVRSSRHERLRSEPCRVKSSLRSRQFDRIHIQANELPAWLETLDPRVRLLVLPPPPLR